MFMDFRSRLQMSLNRSCSLPVGRFPSASSPYRMSFGILPSSPFYKHAPAIAGVAVSSREYMLGRFALSSNLVPRAFSLAWGWPKLRGCLSRTSVLETLSCQVMFKMRLRLHSPRLASIQKCAQHGHPVYLNFGIFHSSKLSLSGWT